MNPTALLKIIAALMPLMGDKEVGAQMVEEIKAMFTAMSVTAHAIQRIENRLTSIDQKLSIIGKMPLSDEATEQLLIGNYSDLVADAITLGETHNAE